tara:strand:- start:5751 stop:6239 length:489 start_codon:yes stop_codon:yes gene_type:complete
MWLQDTHCADGASQFDKDNSRALVALGTKRGRETCVEMDPVHSIVVFYRDQACRNGRNEYEEFSPHKPSEWEPKCLVLLIEPDSLAALRDELVEQGRVLVHPLYARFLTHLNPDLHTDSLLTSVQPLTRGVSFAGASTSTTPRPRLPIPTWRYRRRTARWGT